MESYFFIVYLLLNIIFWVYVTLLYNEIEGEWRRDVAVFKKKSINTEKLYI
jgi:hypothetical protein